MALSKGGWIVVVLIVIALVLVGTIISTYNSLARKDVLVDNTWAEIDNQLKRRSDLIPNLVETVKGYAAHEKEVFLKVTEARAKVAGAGSISDKIQANNGLAAALSRLLLVVERYPDLKANVNFIRLQDELAGTENRISVERRRYNESVRKYNVTIRRFPTNLLAGLFGFDKAAFFEVPEERQEAPKVKF